MKRDRWRRQGTRGTIALALALALCGVIALAATAGAAGMASHATVGASVAQQIRASIAPPARRHLLPRDASASAATAHPRAASAGPFPFETATSADGLIAVHYYRQSADFGTTTARRAQDTVAHPIADTLGLTLKRRVDIYIYASRADFLAGAPVDNPAETGALTVCGAVASCDVYIELGSDNPLALSDDLPHELTHAVFHQNEDTASIQAYFVFFPRWLDEGLATHDETSDVYSQQVMDAAAHGKLLDILSDFANAYPADTDTDFLAYAEAHDFIGYLIAHHGRDAMHGFLADIRDGNLDLAAERHFGAYLRTLEGRWQASLGVPQPGTNLGYVPSSLPTPGPTAAALPAVTTTLRPFPVAAGGIFPAGWLAVVLGCFAAALLLMTLAWRAALARRKPTTAAPLTLPAPSYTADTLLQSPPDTPAETGRPTHPYAVPELAQGAGYETTQPPPFAAGATQPPPVPFPAGRASKPAPRPRWYDWTLAFAAAPAVVAAGLAALDLDSLHEWRHGFVVAALVALPLLLGALALAVHHGRAGGVPPFRALTLAGFALLVVVPWLQATPAGQAQGLAYESRGAYALALRYYADAGLPDAQRDIALARVHRRWAAAAHTARDEATAAAQMRDAVALDDLRAAPADRVSLTQYVDAWGASLLGAQQFQRALDIYAGQAASATCDAACHTEMHGRQAAAYLTWGDALLMGDHPDDARSRYQSILSGYADTPAAATARTADREVAARQALDAALAAGNAGDASGMNAQLRALLQQYPGSLAAAEAPATPEPVQGRVMDSSGAGVAGDRLFLLGFASEAAARAFDFQFRPDGSVVKVATTIGAGGSFSVRLPPGLWYVACWDDPSQAQYENFNIPAAAGNDAFYVPPLAPGDAGTVVGY